MPFHVTSSSNVAQHLFTTNALSPGTLRVASFVGEESISQPFRFEIELVSADPDIDFADVINRPAALITMRGPMEAIPFYGIVTDFQQAGRTEDQYGYRAILMPRFWLLSLNYQSRIFQNMTVEEIVTQVLQEAGLTGEDFEFNLKGNYPTREYTVQYRETDLNFVSRLLEHEGILYYFNHDERDILVMTDDSTESPPIPGENTVDYNPGSGLVPDSEAIREFIMRERVVTGKVILKEYNYRTPDVNLKSESQINDEMPGKYYEYGQHFQDQAQGDRLAAVRNEEIECQRRIVYGDSNCSGLRSGHKFTFAKHYRESLNGDYLITRVRHFGTHGGSLPRLSNVQMDEQSRYRNEFTCIPVAVTYRPPRVTPVPNIPGIMTARTETTGGEYAFIDEEGRYRARMHFDLGEAAEGEATRPIRMNQPYSGPGYGIHFPNHAETEMVWACINGNPDRPIALGTVSNPSQQSPSVSTNKQQNVIRTWGQNELTFDDTKGEENIYMHATKNHTVDVTNNQSVAVGVDQSINIGHDRTKTVKNDENNTIEKNRSITVNGTHTETIKGDTKIEITEGTYELDVKAKAATFHVKGAVKETYDDNQETTVNGNIIVKSKTSKVHITAATEIQLQVGASKLLMKSDGSIELSGVNVAIKGTASVNVKGLSITSQADVDHNTKGTIVLSEGSATNTIKGGMVMLNP